MKYQRLQEIESLGCADQIIPILEQASRYVRKTMVDTIYHANLDLPRRGHYGSSSSSIEVCLTEIVRLANPYNDFIAWKPHASPSIYAILHLLGELTADDLKSLRRKNSPCQAYFNHWLTPLIEISTGCMGYPLPFCCGRAMGDKMNNVPRRVFVNLGDAEFTMPMGIESMRFGKIQRLNNYGIIVDDNRQSMSGLTTHLMGDRPIEDYFRFLAWNVIVTDGHDIKQLWDAFGDFEREMQVSENPTALVAKTDKWFGLPNHDSVGNHAHMNTITDETYLQFYQENGWEGQAAFCPPDPALQEFFKKLAEILKTNAALLKNESVAIPQPAVLPEPTAPSTAKSTLQGVQEAFHRQISTPDGRQQILYVDPDLGKFPGLLPYVSGPDSVEGEMYSIKNPDGFVIRAGLSDPFAVALAAGLGRDNHRYPVIPLLDGFGLLVSESIKQGSLEGSNFLTLGIETNAWEGLTHQPGTSGNTVFRNLPDRPKTKWGADWEFGVYSYYPCHPREAKVLFEDCVKNQRLAYMKLTGYQPPDDLMKWFNEVKDSDYLKGGYVLGPSYDRPNLVVLTCGREVYSCIVAVQQLRKKYSKIRIQLSVINLLNLITSRREEDQRLMSKLIPDKPAILRVTGLPLDTLGTAYGHDQDSLGTQFLTQSCTQDELAKDQGYDIESIIKAAERALK